MTTLAERIQSVSDLSPREAQHLRALCSSWQLLADLSFSDLLLYVPVSGDDAFQVCAQLRPFTSQTLYSQDMVGTRVSQPEQPIVERAYREGRIWAQQEPVLVDGVPIRMDALPVRCDGRVVAVVTKEGSPATSRRPGRLEQAYLDAAEEVSSMVAEGYFPAPEMPTGEWPRVGDGLFRVDHGGVVVWASPNALSSLRRLGVAQNVLGRRLDELGLGQTAIPHALHTARLLDDELVRGNNHVTLRVVPLIKEASVGGALVLAKDVSEVRQKERMLSVKDATIREIHHRVKNNLQTIASLLRLQGRRLNSSEAKAAIDESVLRISSIALVHETLSEDPSDVAEFAEVARRIARMVADGLVLPDADIAVEVTGTAGALDADLATPLAVTLTELLQNAVEHAFDGRECGHVLVKLERSEGELRLIVNDDGVGLREGATEGSRLGLQIVRSLVGELGGVFDIQSDGGTRVEIRVPVRAAP